jgi:hypothetical protein
MSHPIPIEKVKYADAKKEFRTCAESFLLKAYKLVKSGSKPESKIQIITLMQAIKNLLSTLKVEIDTSWEERAKEGAFSVEEFNIAAKELWAAGHRLQSAMSDSWPVKDEMNLLLDALMAVQFDESENN